MRAFVCAIVGVVTLVVARYVIASAGGDTPPDLDCDVSCCVPEVELPPTDTCEGSDPFFGWDNDGYCQETQRADGSYYCRTSNTCTCGAAQMQGVWQSASCATTLFRPYGEEQDKCCRVFKDLECTVYDGDCEVGAGQNSTYPDWHWMCIGCVKTLSEPQPVVLPFQSNVICCDAARGGNCKVCDPTE